jgi:hypothetical protein
VAATAPVRSTTISGGSDVIGSADPIDHSTAGTGGVNVICDGPPPTPPPTPPPMPPPPPAYLFVPRGPNPYNTSAPRAKLVFAAPKHPR